MRRAVTCIVLLALLYSQCSPLYYSGYSRIDVPITVSDVVGEVIDTEERERYDLFKGIEDFEQAQFYPIEQGGLCAEIQTKLHKLIVVNRDRQTHMILREYVENYEWIMTSREVFERKWRIVDYDILGFPITKDEIARCVNPMTRWGCSLGTAAMIFAMSSLIAYGIVSPDRNEIIGEPDLALTVFVGGIGVSLVGGLLAGIVADKMSLENAIKSIKKSRVPEIKE
jgi:hypothetical protein